MNKGEKQIALIIIVLIILTFAVSYPMLKGYVDERIRNWYMYY